MRPSMRSIECPVWGIGQTHRSVPTANPTRFASTSECLFLLKIVVIILVLSLSACSAAPGENTPAPSVVPDYDMTRAVPPTAPAPIEGGFRDDSGGRVVFRNPERPLFIMFYEDTCGTCIAMRPDVHALEAEFWGKIDFVYLARDDAEKAEIVRLYEVRDVPEFVLVAPDGTTIHQWRGAPPIEDLQAAMESLLDALQSSSNE